MSKLPEEHLQKLTEQLIRHEGTRRDAEGRHTPYCCSAGALTIGYGHNLDANPIPGMGATSRLTEEEARRLLATDMRKTEEEVREALPFAEALTPARYAVLVNMAFNLGTARLLTFKNTSADVAIGEYTAALRRMLRSRWAAQVGRRAVELARQMDSGGWQ